ncbi:MAG: hypothetical protein R2729_29340 [Bryobacteraceae bacterium]
MTRTDPYKLAILGPYFGFPGHILMGWTLKALTGLGDRVAGAFLLATSEQQLHDPASCRAFARAARYAFEHPEAIACDADRTPILTIHLLRRMLAKEFDEATRRDLGDALVLLSDLLQRESSEDDKQDRG